MSNAQPFEGRRKARIYALQSLYAWVLSGNNLSAIEQGLLIEKSHVDFDREYFHRLLFDVPQDLANLDAIIAEFLIGLTVQEVDPVELTVLRIAVYELTICLEIPYKVIINEALNLTKKFGSIEGFKFVNGVLDKIAKAKRPNG